MRQNVYICKIRTGLKLGTSKINNMLVRRLIVFLVSKTVLFFFYNIFQSHLQNYLAKMSVKVRFPIILTVSGTTISKHR